MESLRAIEIFNDNRFMLITIESVDFQHSKTVASCWLYANIKTIAVIVSDPDEIYALDMDAKLIALDQLKQDIPELDAIIESRHKV